jgi:hypothetical protein
MFIDKINYIKIMDINIMSPDINDALDLFNEVTGTNDLSDGYRQKLSELHLNETDGYIVKLKLNNEILSGKLAKEDVIPRLNYVLNLLSSHKSHNNHIFQFNKDVLLYLNNHNENKVICEKCGCPILAIDKYCYNCGYEQVPQITLFELLSSIKSTQIKPGDILRINRDNTIELTSFNEDPSELRNIIEDKELEDLYENKIEKIELYHHYFKVILLYYIKKYESIEYINKEVYSSYKINNVLEVINELANDGLIKIRKGKFYQNFSNFLSVLDYKDIHKIANKRDNWLYSLTDKGEAYLNNNKHVLIYNFFIINTCMDDIISFDNFISTNQNVDQEDLLVSYIIFKRENFFKERMLGSCISSYDLEAYYYEINKDTLNQIVTLLKKFIFGLNYNYMSVKSIKPIDSNFIEYLSNVLTDNSINMNKLKISFSTAYDSMNVDKLIFSKEESLNYLLKCLNSEDINNMNFELTKIYHEKIND